ncbi:MAG TPA: response regulator transcription factor [Candidatus Limnocylindria bacterium]|nr:response regulator transcription factor [Candidatus Limnocylindria bacterium]
MRRSPSRSPRSAGPAALPERARVALEADELARERLVRLLGALVHVVPRDEAEIVLHDAPGSRAALAAIADGFLVPTVLLVDDPHAELTRAALAGGAAAVLARQSDARELSAALDAVAAGLLVLDASARDALRPRPLPVGTTTLRQAQGDTEPLTQREREVLAMLARGLSNRRIAERLSITDNTVKAHVAQILAKLGAATRTEAVTVGIRQGLVML